MKPTNSYRKRGLQIAAGLCIASAGGWMACTLPDTSVPLGSDWGHHFTAAEYIWHPGPDVQYPLFRRPWYGWLLGAVGEHTGYFAAGLLIGRISALLMVIAAGVGAWALAGPLAGAAAAVCASWMPLIHEGGLWVNHYPLLGAMCGLAIAAGAVASRWPRVPWVVLAGAAAGSTACIDVRGEVALLVVAGLVGIGLPWARNWRRTGLLLVCLLGSAGATIGHGVWLDRAFDIPELEFEEQVFVQRKGVLEQIQRGVFEDPALEQACAGVHAGPMDLAGLTTPCATALRRSGHHRLMTRNIVPGWATLSLIGLALLPVGAGRRERLRSLLAAGLVFGVPAGALMVGMGWVTYFPRYVLPFASVIAMIIPVAAYRALAVWRHRWWLSVPSAGAALGWMLVQWPTSTPIAGPAPVATYATDRASGEFARWVLAHMEDGDGLVDCAGLALDSLLLPREIEYVRYPAGDPHCVPLIQSPRRRAGASYLITQHVNLPEVMAEGTRTRHDIAVHGWTPQATEAPEGYQLWLLGREE